MRRFLAKWMSVLLLILLTLLWLYPEWLGLGALETRAAQGEAIIVRDGDTMTIGGLDQRLHGADAPEYEQVCQDGKARDWPCGRQARDTLVILLAGRTINCAERARDKYGRVVATCHDERGVDLARAMIEAGMAVNMGGFTDGPYADEEAQAKAKRIGLWRGRFDPPANWRETHPRAPTKGNAS